jgi:hypothetical protein
MRLDEAVGEGDGSLGRVLCICSRETVYLERTLNVFIMHPPYLTSLDEWVKLVRDFPRQLLPTLLSYSKPLSADYEGTPLLVQRTDARRSITVP